MIGIVLVSHSPALAGAALDLALQMVPGERPKIAIAAGAEEGVIGTDATKVAAAIDEVAGPDGVLVMMDLGSAVMSTELALEFISTTSPVTLSAAPFVEGLIAAVVRAAGGATLAEVELEARGALDAKRGALGEAESASEVSTAVADTVGADTVADRMTLVNRDGLHTRPAANLVSALSGFDAKVSIGVDRGTVGKRVDARSLISLLSLGAKAGEVLEVEASGPQANDAMARMRELVADGFGEEPS
jgi:dihydroxyacetone kinase phosphotransfer subunit